MKLVKKILGENKVEAVLRRLDRLTQDEACATAAQTLEVVYGLVQNTRVVMDGEATLSLIAQPFSTSCLLGGKASAESIWDALGTFV